MAEIGTRPSGGKKTLVEEGTTFKGSMTSSCPVEIKGRIEGDVEAPALTISESGSLEGKAKVGQIESQGALAGEIDADSVKLAGRVNDNTVIRAQTLEVKLTAPEATKMQVTFGNCILAVGEEPTDDGQPGKKGKKKKDGDDNWSDESGQPA